MPFPLLRLLREGVRPLQRVRMGELSQTRDQAPAELMFFEISEPWTAALEPRALSFDLGLFGAVGVRILNSWEDV